MLIFERHTGCLLAARLRPGNASSHARIVPMLLRLVPRLQAAFPGVKIKLRGDAGFALPLLYQFCEFFGIQYALGIPANCVFQRRAEPRQKRLKRRYRRTQVTAAQLLQLPPSRPQLAAPAPHLLQGRAHRHRNQPALPHHQLCRIAPPRSSLSTTIAASARTASRSSRTAFAPTA